MKNILIFLFILLGFIFILLLPREREITVLAPMVMQADYPFTLELYKERIDDFISHFKSEKGFGEARTGVPISEEVKRLFARSLKIIIPSYVISMLLGTLCGIFHFYFRRKQKGNTQAFFIWLFSSVPDFFLYISMQYIMIKLIRWGFPQFDLFGHENWYSFIFPMLVITIFPFLHMVKMTTASLENEIGQEYIRTAYSKGVSKLKVLKHMLWNCGTTLLNQSQLVMIYILSSLPIIEKLSSYNGAGYQLLLSILENEEIRALAFMLPFLFLMFIVIVFSQTIKFRLYPKSGGLS